MGLGGTAEIASEHGLHYGVLDQLEEGSSLVVNVFLTMCPLN